MEYFLTIAASLLIVIGISLIAISARFIQQIKFKIAGNAIGLLMFLGGILLIFFTYYSYYEEFYLYEFYKTLFWFVVPVLTCAIILIPLRLVTHIPDYIFRKILHLIAISTVIPLTIATSIWWISEITIGLFFILIIVAVMIFEQIPFYNHLFVEKNKHEVLFSFSFFFIIMALLVLVFWGYKGEEYRYLPIVAIMAWGPGDAMAAIIGQEFGKHKFSWKFVDNHKSIEGSVAMAITSLIITFVLLFFLSAYPWWLILIQSLVVGLFSSFAELISKKGLDTIACPFVAGLILFLFSFI